MAEEIELIRVSMQGTEMAVKLAGTTLKNALKVLKFLVTVTPRTAEWIRENEDKNIRRKMRKAEWEQIKKGKIDLLEGNVEFKRLVEKYGHEGLTLLNIPDMRLKSFSNYAKEYGLSYSVLPDLNDDDGMTQIMVPVSEKDIFARIIKSLEKEEINRIEKAKEEMQKEIQEIESIKSQAKIKKKNAEDNNKGVGDDEYDEAVNEIAWAEQRLSELKEQKEIIENQRSRECTFEDYRKTNETIFNHADFCSNLQKAGIEVNETSNIDDFVKIYSRDDLSKVAEDQIEYCVEPDTDFTLIKTPVVDENKKVTGIKYELFKGDKKTMDAMTSPTSSPDEIKNFISIGKIKDEKENEKREIRYNEMSKKWFVIKGENDYKKYRELLKKNQETLKNKESIVSVAESIVGISVKEKLKEETIANDKKSKNILIIPKEANFPEVYEGRMGIFSKDNTYFIPIEKRKIFKNKDGDFVVNLKNASYNNSDAAIREGKDTPLVKIINENDMYKPITVNKKALIVEENDAIIKTRVPGTYGRNALYMDIEKNKIQKVFKDTAYLTYIDVNKTYNLSNKDGMNVQMDGKKLLSHYENQESYVRGNKLSIINLKTNSTSYIKPEKVKDAIREIGEFSSKTTASIGNAKNAIKTR